MEGPVDRDARQLQALGYAQQLLRDMGGFSNFALSFSIISILTGAVTLYGYGLRMGGPLEMALGWPLVSLLTLPVAASLAQLASSYPTAGALYHWSSILGGRGAGFFTAWLNTIGQFAITAGIDYGLAEFVAAMLGLPADRAHVLPVYAAVLASHAVLNHLGVRIVGRLNQLSAWVHVLGVAAILVSLLWFAPLRPASFLIARFTDAPRPYALGFLLGLLQAAWTFTGYDASAHACEETHDPTRNAPWGIFLSVAVSGVFGWALLLAVTLAMGDLPSTVATENPFIHVLRGALGQRLGGALVLVAMVAMWFCGLSSVTSNSRMLFAFARDGGLPFSKAVARVSPTFRSPHVAVWISAAAAFLLALWAPAYSAMVALSTIALYVSYGIPIACGLLARRSGRWQRRGPWDLGRASRATNLAALAWIGTLTVLFVLPPNEIAGYTFAAALLVLGAYWVLWMRKRFNGPPRIQA
ncbi:MAG TPA: amino acid permease [Myxococcales bacterium]|nr:amino acid permease [Myxococcales bacterium]